MSGLSGLSGLSGIFKGASIADYHVFIVAGQSNAQGYTNGTTIGVNGYDEARPDPASSVAYYWDETNSEVRDITATATTPKDSRNNPDNILVRSVDGGWQNKFAIDYAAASGKKVLIIDGSYSGSGVIAGVDYEGAGGSTDNWPDDNLDDALITQWTNFKAWAVSHGLSYEFRGVLWCQGESERRDQDSGAKSQAQLETALTDLFGFFNTNLSADLVPGGTLINVVLTAPGGLSGGATANEWSGPQIYRYGAGSKGDLQVTEAYYNVIDALSYVRMLYGESRYLARSSYLKLWDAVHWKQSAYNTAGAAIALEMYTPGSGLAAPGAPTSISVVNNSPWRNTISWTNPANAGNAKTGYVEIRIHRSTSSGFTLSTANLVGATRTTADTSWTDAYALAPATTYYYKVIAWNPGAWTAGSEVSTTTESLASIPSAFNTAASPSDTTTITNLWNDIVSGGYNVGLVALLPLKNTLNKSAPTTVYNMVRPATNATIHDFTTTGSMVYDGTSGFLDFDGVDDKATSVSSNGVLPRSGPFTWMMAMNLIAPGAAKAFAYQQPTTGIRTILTAQTSGAVQFYNDEQAGTTLTPTGIAGSIKVFTVVYDPDDTLGRYHLYDGSSTPISSYTANPRKFNLRDLAAMAWGVNTNPAQFVALELAAMAVWNRALTGAEHMAMRTILSARIGLGF